MRRNGFTLIELLMVIVILGLLASIAMGKYKSIVARSYRAASISALHELHTHQMGYYSLNLRFAANLNQLDEFEPRGVEVLMRPLEGEGFVALSRHAKATGVVCIIVVEGTLNKGQAKQFERTGFPPGAEGEITCQDGAPFN